MCLGVHKGKKDTRGQERQYIHHLTWADIEIGESKLGSTGISTFMKEILKLTA